LVIVVAWPHLYIGDLVARQAHFNGNWGHGGRLPTALR
jgi:hypothetical protein